MADFSCPACDARVHNFELYCWQCGGKLDDPTSDSMMARKKEVKSLKEYVSKKPNDRRSNFQKKAVMSSSTTKKSFNEKDSRVVINVGIIRENSKGILSTIRGSKLPVQVNMILLLKC